MSCIIAETLTNRTLARATVRILLSIVFGLIVLQMRLNAQPPSLQILSPTAGTIMMPGQLFTVTVSVGQGTPFTGVFVIAQNVGISPTLASAPFTFSFVAPGGGFLGALALTAVGVPATGSPVFSPSVVISVEKVIALSKLSASPQQIAFAFAGQQVPLIVTGTFVDGSTADVTASSQIRYSSNDATVAQVGNGGMVVAVGSGAATSTQIVITYGAQTTTVPVTMPKSIRGDLNGDGKVDQDDLNIILGALNTAAIKPIDARDLNGDGVINALDSRILVTLCTRAGCATH